MGPGALAPAIPHFAGLSLKQCGDFKNRWNCLGHQISVLQVERSRVALRMKSPGFLAPQQWLPVETDCGCFLSYSLCWSFMIGLQFPSEGAARVCADFRWVI